MVSYRIIVLSILIIAMALMYFKTREGMTAMSPVDYAENDVSDDGLLLKGYYRTKENPGISQHSSEDGLRLYPKTAMSSYEQKTNNKRHWFTPCDGSSVRADMCGGLYKGKALKKQQNVVPSMTSGRVNMYDAAEF
jgi:hypothetical protein